MCVSDLEFLFLLYFVTGWVQKFGSGASINLSAC